MTVNSAELMLCRQKHEGRQQQQHQSYSSYALNNHHCSAKASAAGPPSVTMCSSVYRLPQQMTAALAQQKASKAVHYIQLKTAPLP